MPYQKNFLLLAASVALFTPAIVPSASHAALSGAYGFSRMAAGFPGSTEAMALAGSGSITFDSDGNCSARFDDTELRLNLATGNVESSSGSQNRTCRYSAASNGDLAVTFTDNNVTYRGSVSADGASLNLAGSDSDTPGQVQMLLAHKSGSGMNAASLSGLYPVAWSAAGYPSVAESGVIAGTGAITFDGAGGCTANLPAPGYQLNRLTGETLQLLPTLNLDYECGYSIGNDGTAAVTLTRNEELFTYQGSVSTDGSSFTLAGQSSETEQSVILMTGNRVARNSSTAYLRGSFGITRMSLGFPGGAGSRVMAGRGTISFNGSGRCSASFIDAEYAQAPSSGAVADYSDAENLSCSYSADPDGVTLSFDNSSFSYRGQLSADGSSLTLTGLDHSLNTAILLAGERLAVRYPSADIAGKWISGGIRTPVKDTNDPQRFGYDVERMVLHADGSGTSETISTSEPSGGIEQLPAGAVAVHDEEAMRQLRDGYFFMNAGKDVMFLFRQDLQAGEQQLFVNLKQADSYSMAGLAGTWMSAGIKTPGKYIDDPALFGYNIRKMVIAADGSGQSTDISSSDSPPVAPATFPAGTATIASDGAISLPKIAHSYMNAAQDVMFQVNSADGAQQLRVNVKQGSNYALQDLAGNWFGAGIKTPLQGSSSTNFGYEVVKLVVNSSGTGTGTPLSPSSDLLISNIYNFGIKNDGAITTFNMDTESFFLNASKNVLVQFKRSGTDQQLFVYLKEAPVPVFPLNGACGSAHGATFADAPFTNLCSSGTPTAVTGSGPWNWSCSGKDGGTTSNCSANANFSTWTLTVTVAGNGAVNGSSDGSDAGVISCTSDSASGCSASFRAGEQVQVTATAGAGSLFGSWSGSITGRANPTPIIMDGDKAITATFNAVPKVMVASKGFATLQAAYDDAGTVEGSVLRLLEGFLPGSFTAWKSIAVKVEGGYNETFGSRNSSTSVESPFRVKGGQVRVQGVKIKPQQ